MSGRGRQALPDGREWSGGPAACLRVVGRCSKMSGSGLKSGSEALPDVWELSGGRPGCPRVIGRPTRISGCGRESLQDG